MPGGARGRARGHAAEADEWWAHVQHQISSRFALGGCG